MDPSTTGAEIVGAFYIEFDNKLGPKIGAQYPERCDTRCTVDSDQARGSVFPTELLEDVGDYIIPKEPCLLRNLVSLTGLRDRPIVAGPCSQLTQQA